MELNLKIQLHSINLMYNPTCSFPRPLIKDTSRLGGLVVNIVTKYSQLMITHRRWTGEGFEMGHNRLLTCATREFCKTV